MWWKAADFPSAPLDPRGQGLGKRTDVAQFDVPVRNHCLPDGAEGVRATPPPWSGGPFSARLCRAAIDVEAVVQSLVGVGDALLCPRPPWRRQAEV
jgi:hypothetical protein